MPTLNSSHLQYIAERFTCDTIYCGVILAGKITKGVIMAGKLITELLEVINDVANEDNDVELDLKKFETTLTALEVEFAAKDTKIGELEGEIKKFGKEVKTLTESNENNIEVVDSLKNEKKELCEVIANDVRFKAEWLKDDKTLEELKGDLEIPALLELKKLVEKGYNELYGLDSEVLEKVLDGDNLNNEDYNF